MHPLVNYQMLNNPNSHGPKEWRHHVPAVEEAGYITVGYTMIRATLKEDLLSVKKAKNRSDWLKWKVVMDTEIMQLNKQGTYKLVDLPPDHQVQVNGCTTLETRREPP